MFLRPKFWVISAIVLAVLLVVADRGGKILAERVVASRVQDALSTPDKPSVHLGGFPFLTQLFGNRFDRVEVDIRDGDAGRVRVEHVHAVLTGVKRAGTGAIVDSITGQGVINYADASQAAKPLIVAYGGSGLVKVTEAGVASATGRPRIEGNTLVVKPESVAGASVGGLVPDIKIPLRQIPKGMTIKLNPTEAGIEFSFDGTNLELSSKDVTASLGLLPVWPTTDYARPRTAA